MSRLNAVFRRLMSTSPPAGSAGNMIISSVSNSCKQIVLNSPKTRNALSLQMMETLRAELQAV